MKVRIQEYQHFFSFQKNNFKFGFSAKYQHVLPTDEIHENGDAHTLPSQKNNPLSGLLGNYNSDSDNEETNQKSNSTLDAKVEDFLKEIHSISAEGSNHPYGTSNIIQPNKHSLEETLYPPSVTAWQQCYDHNSGYPYYWNTETNEVTWEMPADLKAAIANIAAKQQEQQQQQQQVQIPNQQPQLSAEVTKKVCKYPWQTESDSEDEKIEMITSFGPQSGEESEEDDLTNKKYDKSKKVANTVGPQLPIASHTPCMDPSKIRSNCISLAPEDPEGLSEPNYETSSLLAHGVQDTGPPGDDSFLTTSESVSSDKVVTSCTKNDLVVNKLGNETTSVNTSVGTNKNLTVECSSIKPTNIVKDSTEEHCIEKPDVENCSLADDVIAQIEKETPPDYKEDQKVEKPVQLNESEAVLAVPELLKSSSAKSSGIALLANYGDDSESEDNNFSEKHKNSKSVKTPSKSLFPIDIPEEKEKIKTLFPCAETDLPKMSSETRAKDLLQEEPESVNNIYNSEVDVSDPAAHKAFKRKKRLEFATTTYGPSTSKWPELKSSSPEQAVSVSNTLYNMDPFMNEHRGFGFNSLRTQIDSEKKTYKNFGGIQFVKAETINPSGITESKERIENEPENCSK